ncbi:SHOCT domain-containing protein [Allocoleopsis sp.]|uniref:SHOCT domain-containing protein n=1 Tax=Allocoleopsis sp. TaxID=3088169 RepID=UPI002FD0AB35
MNKFLSNLSRTINEGMSEVSTQTSAEAQRNEELSKLEIKIKEIDLKLDKTYTLIGQAVADTLRKTEPVTQEFIVPLFIPIKELDWEREQLLEAIKQIKAKQAEQLKAQELIRTKKEVQAELQKLQELKDMGVIDAEEFEVTEAKLNKRIHNFEKLYNLKIAFDRNLISRDEYMSRKAMLE